MERTEFTPWSWRESTAMSGGHRRPDDLAPDTGREDSIAADQQATTDLVGYHVEATDGSIGSIDEATYDVGGAHLVVDTGPWIFGRKVLLPAGTVERVDNEDRRVYVDRTKDQIKDSPAYDKDTFGTQDYRDQVGTYYSDSYRNSPPLR